MPHPSARQNQPQAYYPSMVVTFRIRFDEASGFFDIDMQDKEKLKAHYYEGRKYLSSDSQIASIPLFTNGANDSLTRVMNRVPKSGTVELSPYRQASKFSFTFSYDAVPIDPRLIRAVGVEIYADTVDADRFAVGQHGNGKAYSRLIPRKSVIPKTDDNLVLVGTLDEWEVVHDSSGSWINVSGRDLRGILLDSPADPGLMASLDLTQPIDSVIRQIIDRHPMLYAVEMSGTQVPSFTPSGKLKVQGAQSAMIVATNPGEWPDGRIPSPMSKDGVTRVRLTKGGKTTPIYPKKGKTTAQQIPPGPYRPGYDPNNQQLYYQNPGAPLSPVTTLQKTPQSAQPVKGSVKADPNRVSFWDMITQYCFLVGAIPYFDAHILRIRPSRSLYDTLEDYSGMSTVGSPQQAFKDRVRYNRGSDGSYITRAWRRLVYGRDISKFRMTRKFNGFRPRIVEVVSINTSSKDPSEQMVLTAQWPKMPLTRKVKKRNNKAHKAKFKYTNISPSGFRTEAEILRVPVPGFTDPQKLEDLARGIFEEVMRGEFVGSVTTSNLASEGGDNADPDLLKCRPGDPIEFLTDTRVTGPESALSNSVVKMQSAPFWDAVTDVAGTLGGAQPTQADINFATLIVASSRKMVDQLSFFRIKSVKFNWSDTGGMKISLDFQNYLEVRFGTRDPKGWNGPTPWSKEDIEFGTGVPLVYSAEPAPTLTEALRRLRANRAARSDPNLTQYKRGGGF